MRKAALILAGGVTVLALSLTTVAPKTPQKEKDKTTSHNETSSADTPDTRVTPPVEQNVPLQSPATKKEGKSKDDDPTNSDWWTIIPGIITALATLVLAIVGALGVCFAVRTLRAIESQTNVLSESQRPRIVVEAAEHPSQTFADQHARRVVFKVVNKGLMPATEYSYESWIEVLPNTSGDFTDAADHFSCDVVSVLYPDTPHRINVPLRNSVTDEEALEISKMRKYVCVRIRTEYKDPFIPNRRCYADFGFYLIPTGLGFLDKHNGVGYEDKKS